MTALDPAVPRQPPADASTTLDVQSSAFVVTIVARTPMPAAPAEVWRVLTDTARYPDWNPFVRALEGELTRGARLRVTLAPAGKEQRLRPRVVAVDPGRSFTWLGHVGVPGVLDGRHTFTVETAGATGVLVQHERLSGLLVPAFRGMLTRDAPRAFVALNEALAARVARAA